MFEATAWNINKTSAPAPGWSPQGFKHHPVRFCKYVHFVEWSGNIFRYHPESDPYA